MTDSTLLLRIVDRIEDLLKEGLPPSYAVFRSREEAIDQGQAPSVVLLLGTTSTKSFGDEVDQHETEIQIGIHVRGDPWDQLAEQADALVHGLIARDEPLELLVSNLRRIGATPDASEADSTAGVLMVAWRVIYLTRRADPTSAP